MKNNINQVTGQIYNNPMTNQNNQVNSQMNYNQNHQIPQQAFNNMNSLQQIVNLSNLNPNNLASLLGNNMSYMDLQKLTSLYNNKNFNLNSLNNNINSGKNTTGNTNLDINALNAYLLQNEMTNNKSGIQMGQMNTQNNNLQNYANYTNNLNNPDILNKNKGNEQISHNNLNKNVQINPPNSGNALEAFYSKYLNEQQVMFNNKDNYNVKNNNFQVNPNELEPKINDSPSTSKFSQNSIVKESKLIINNNINNNVFLSDNLNLIPHLNNPLNNDQVNPIIKMNNDIRESIKTRFNVPNNMNSNNISNNNAQKELKPANAYNFNVPKHNIIDTKFESEMQKFLSNNNSSNVANSNAANNMNISNYLFNNSKPSANIINPTTNSNNILNTQNIAQNIAKDMQFCNIMTPEQKNFLAKLMIGDSNSLNNFSAYDTSQFLKLYYNYTQQRVENTMVNNVNNKNIITDVRNNSSVPNFPNPTFNQMYNNSVNNTNNVSNVPITSNIYNSQNPTNNTPNKPATTFNPSTNQYGNQVNSLNTIMTTYNPTNYLTFK